MKRSLLLLPLLLSCSAPSMAQNALEILNKGMADWAYGEIRAHLKNFHAANDAKDFTLACSELRTMLARVRDNLRDLQEHKPEVEWIQWRQSWLPMHDWCDKSYY